MNRSLPPSLPDRAVTQHINHNAPLSPTKDRTKERAEVSIFRPFFLAGIVSVLTTGCLLGAIALLGISLRGNYTASEWTPYILAHANSQVYGWVGLFVMGFALQQHPPRVSRAGLFHRLAFLSLALIGLSIGLRFLAEPLMASRPDIGLPLGIVSGIMQAASVFLFVANTGLTRYRVRDAETGEAAGLPWQSKFVFASLGWWMLVAIAEPFVFALSHQPDKTASILFVAKWFVPYREAQFLGFVVNMIFGVALARLHTDFSAPAADRDFGKLGFAVWNLGLLARIFGWLTYFNAEMTTGSGWIYFGSGVTLMLGACLLILSSRLFEPVAHPVPSLRFIRAAFGWLLTGGLLMALEPLHLGKIDAPFSHAYTGAIRHAITVGFISQMILGVSLQIVPRLRGVKPPSGLALWSIFLLLNLGNTLRVVCEIITDYSAASFIPMGFTGFVELIALTIWAYCIVKAMFVSAPVATIRQKEDVGSAHPVYNPTYQELPVYSMPSTASIPKTSKRGKNEEVLSPVHLSEEGGRDR